MSATATPFAEPCFSAEEIGGQRSLAVSWREGMQGAERKGQRGSCEATGA